MLNTVNESCSSSRIKSNEIGKRLKPLNMDSIISLSMVISAAWSMEPVLRWPLWTLSRYTIIVYCEQYNGSPANFLDVGGKATDSEIVAALKIMDRDPNVEAILVNIFAGIARCDIIALGLIKGLTTLGMKKPMVLRLKGTNVDEARQLIADSGFNMIFTEDLDEAAIKAVKMSAILRMAKEANLNVNLTS